MKISQKIASVALTLALAMAGVVATAVPAGAHTPGDSATCSQLNVKHTQYSSSKSDPTPNKITVYVDGNVVDTVKFGESYVKSFTLTPSWQAHTWQVIVKTPDGYDYNSGVKTTKPCDRPVPPKPPVKEVPGSVETTDCSVPTHIITRWKDVTTYIFDEKKWEWVEETTTRIPLPTITRDLTEAEQRACAGDQPETKVEYGNWVDEKNSCDARAIKRTRTVSITTYTLVGIKWVANEPVVTTDVDYRAKTAEEIYECLPEINANAGAEIVALCGVADVTLTNEKLGEKQKTASFVVYVDGEYYGAYAVPVGETESVHLTFPEDSGDHTVTVRTGAAFGDVLLASATVHSDCILPADDREVRTVETVDCLTELVTSQEQARTRSYSYVDNVAVAGAWSEWANTDTPPTTREATVAELDEAECPVTEQPEDKVIVKTTETIAQICGNPNASITTTTTKTPFILVERVWVEDTANAVTTTEKSTRPLTNTEREDLAKALNCDKSLAITGADPWAAGGIALLLLALGATALLVKRPRKVAAE